MVSPGRSSLSVVTTPDPGRSDGRPPQAVGRPGNALRTSLLIGLCSFLLYNANLRSITAGDTYPARYLPFAILQGTLFLDPVASVAVQGRTDTAYWMSTRSDGHRVSIYPVVVPVLVAPLYLPAMTYLHWAGWTDPRLDHWARAMEKISASFVAALSASLMFLLLRRRIAESDALWLTAAYAFGTTTWMIGSQALWQHGMAELLVIGVLLFLVSPPSGPRIAAAGLLLGLIPGNRPPDLILAGVLWVCGLLWWGRRRAALLAAAAVPPLVLVMFYNLKMTGNMGGGYGQIGSVAFFQQDLLTGMAGLLISPTRGLVVFSPFLLFLGLAWWRPPHDRSERRVVVAMSLGCLAQILLYAKTDWRGGLSFGPRYLTDCLPFLIWMLAPVVGAQRAASRVFFRLAVLVAILIEAIGAFCYFPSLDLPIYAADPGAGVYNMRPAFEWRNAPFVTSLKHRLAPPELALLMRGSIDTIEVDGRATEVIDVGQNVAVSGWALSGRSTPVQVALSIDNRAVTAVQTFHDRPDIRDVLPGAGPSGWRINLMTSGLLPGEHRLTLMVWVSELSDVSFVATRTLKVRTPGE